ncbi:hypothetical protein J41TS2_25130 [Bacillus sonorensis]|uniref:hypothetical protein n=1 Tax=Bacillus sonorensis TaxID=119858 RepID=UPI001B018F08|nr:hypothetical protein [Bacillus sonorensis]GIN67092.1 hypothetical protein J41TS2_25130 [Bacillus sonorensis]
MKFGIYLDGILMEKFNSPEEAYDAGRSAFEESGLFHEIRLVHPFEKTIEEM